jgi:3',5'-cyclic AMP phosphodiesterase CpdA
LDLHDARAPFYRHDMVVIAHLSDIHVDDGERSVERTARVMRYLAGLPRPVDVVLVTGDLADHGAPDEYTIVEKLLALPVPVLTCPGNHDDSALLPGDTAHVVAGALFAMCDSSIAGRNEGVLTDATLAWLDAELRTHADRPAFVCFHHPPVTLGIPFVDGIRQFGAERLAEVVERHPNVVAVLCGHAHTPAATTFAGRPLLVAPGVVSTAMLPFETDAIVDLDLPPLLAFHLLDDERRLTTHFRVVS